MLFLCMTETFVDDLFEGLAPYLLENMIILKQWEQFSSQKNVRSYKFFATNCKNKEFSKNEHF